MDRSNLKVPLPQLLLVPLIIQPALALLFLPHAPLLHISDVCVTGRLDKHHGYRNLASPMPYRSASACRLAEMPTPLPVERLLLAEREREARADCDNPDSLPRCGE